LRNSNAGAREATARAVGGIGAAAGTPEILSHLLAGLRDPNREVRYWMAKAVGNIGGAAAQPEFLALLVAGLRDLDKDVRMRMAQALRGIGTAAATPKVLADLAAGLRDPDHGVRRSAKRAVGSLGSAAGREILERLAELSVPTLYDFWSSFPALVLAADSVRIIRSRARWTLHSLDAFTRRLRSIQARIFT
jgi:HEAT repeat protein